VRGASEPRRVGSEVSKKEEIVVLNEEGTDPACGKKPEERSVEELLELGLVVLDKPVGPSSHEVSAWAGRICGAQKAGHSGTLDPNVSGVLAVGLNDATKAMGFLLKSKKEYVGIIRFHRVIDENDVKRAFRAFTGEITQLPPVRSAVRRRERKRKVYYLDVLEYNGPEVLFLVGCEAGTYIRKLCFDMGRYLGSGANMLELRRTKAGVLSERESVTLQDLSDAFWLWRERGEEKEMRRCVRPVEDAVDMRRIWLRDTAVEAVCSGAQLAVPGIAKFERGASKGEAVALMTLKGELAAIADMQMAGAELEKSKEGIAAATRRVVMRKGTYPKMWKTHGRNASG
jgi:H/ACA ribonucleoprotein complex subunit 4